MNNNPLRQYFRRPSVYLKLPSGVKNYSPDIINIPETEELPIYPMTAIDEITIKTPDALYNGSAIIEIVKSCVPNIIDPWGINSIDLDAILIAIRAASSGDGLELATTCPKCQEESEFKINLGGVLSTISSKSYDEELQVNELKFKFKPLSYYDLNQTNIKQFEIQKIFRYVADLKDTEEQVQKTREAIAAITELTMEVITKSIHYIRTPTSIVEEKEFIMDFLHNCDKNTYIKIRDFNAALKENTAIRPFDVKCPSCENEYKQPFTVNYTDFFV